MSCTPRASSTPSSCLAPVCLALARTPVPHHLMMDTKLRRHSCVSARARTRTHTRADPGARACAVAAASLRLLPQIPTRTQWLHERWSLGAMFCALHARTPAPGLCRPLQTPLRRYLYYRCLMLGPTRSCCRHVLDIAALTWLHRHVCHHVPLSHRVACTPTQLH